MMRIGFTGDVSFTGIFADPAHITPDLFSKEIINTFKNNDYNVLNIEGPLTEKPFLPKKGISLKSMPGHIQTLKEINCNIFNLANNHIMDCGVEGLCDTIELAQKNNIQYFGAGKQLHEASKEIIISRNGITISLIGVCHREGKLAGPNSPGVFSDQQEVLLRNQIQNARQHADWVIVNYHGGEEYVHIPMPKRRKKLLRYLAWGVDVIIAHHPHVVQGFEQFQGKLIMYSLGNFIFDDKPLYAHSGTEESVLLTIEFEKGTYKLKPIFTKMDRKRRNLVAVDNNDYFTLLDFDTYSYQWCKDCYRVFFTENNVVEKPKQMEGAKKSGVQVLRYIARPRSYLNLYKTLRHMDVRPVFLGACKYAMLRKTGIWT